jgi:hypothetical protein
MSQVKYIAMLLILVFLLQNAKGHFSGEIPVGIKYALTKGSCSELAKFFNKSIVVDILGNDNIYNSNQAENALKAFYSQNRVLRVSILYEGGKGQTQYLISKLTTSNGIFRLTILVKSNVIIQLNIDKENEN